MKSQEAAIPPSMYCKTHPKQCFDLDFLFKCKLLKTAENDFPLPNLPRVAQNPHPKPSCIHIFGTSTRTETLFVTWHTSRKVFELNLNLKTSSTGCRRLQFVLNCLKRGSFRAGNFAGAAVRGGGTLGIRSSQLLLRNRKL